MYSLKKFFSMILLLTVLSIYGLPVYGNQSVFPEFSESKNYGRGVWSAQTHKAAITYDREGNPELVYSTQGGYFYAIDFTTGKIKYEELLENSYIISNATETGSDGKVYFKSYPEMGLRAYDPISKSVSPVREFESDGNFAMAMNGEIDGKVFISTYDPKGAKVFEYDINKKTTTDLGIMKEKAQYIQGFDVTDDYVYAGTGIGADIQACVRYDRKTGEKKELFGQKGGTSVYQIMVSNGIIYFLQWANVLVYDEETIEQIGSYPNEGRVLISRPNPKNMDLVYNICGSDIYEYNAVTREHKMVCSSPIPEAKTLGLKLAGWAELQNGDWVLCFYTDFMSHVGYFNPETNKVSVSKLDKISDSGPQIQNISCSPQGVLYIGGYQTGTSAFDTKTDEFLFNIQEWHQNEGVGFMNGKVYYGTYTDAVIFRYDPNKPLNYLGYNYDRQYQPYGNPGMVYDIQEMQDRPFVLKNYGNKLYIGTISAYAQLGGALTIYEEDEDGTPHAEVFRHVIKDQSITGIAYKDGKVYVSSTIRGGLGIDCTQTQAKIAVFDENKKEVIETVIPDLPKIGTTSQTIGEISFGPDGLLWGCSELDGAVFAMDPDTFEVLKYVETSSGFNRGPMTLPMYLIWGDDGNLYTTAGWYISVINPETMEYKRLIPAACSLMTMDPEGNIWYARGGVFFKLAVNQWDRLQLFLNTTQKLEQKNYQQEEWNLLQQKISSAKSLTKEAKDAEIIRVINDIKDIRDGKKTVKKESDAVSVLLNGEKLFFDEIMGKPILYQGRTMLPFRKLFELFGFNINWDALTQKITAVSEEQSITMVVGDKNYAFNDKIVEFDVPPVLLSGRTYVPVRVVAEAMGYKVEWDEGTQTVLIATP